MVRGALGAVEIYLRDYYSQYHVPPIVLDPLSVWVFDYDHALESELDYWNAVERASDPCVSIACKLQWTRTTFYGGQPYQWEDLRCFNGATSFHMLGPATKAEEFRKFQFFEGILRITGNPNPAASEAFSYLKQLDALVLETKEPVPPEAFQKLSGLTRLHAGNRSVVDETFHHLPNVEEVKLSATNNLTDEAFTSLGAVKRFQLSESQSTVTDEGFRHLRAAYSLSLNNCYHSSITSRVFHHLSGLRKLDIGGCTLTTINDDGFPHLSNLESLSMNWCYQIAISDEAFKHTHSLRSLSMPFCRQTTISDRAFEQINSFKFVQQQYPTKRYNISALYVL